LALGVNDHFKQKSLDYITDRWFLAVENAMKAVSSVIYSEAERAYALFRRPINNSNLEAKSSIIEKLHKIPSKLQDLRSKDYSELDEHVQRLMVRAASAWHDGEYETVINLCLKVLKEIKESDTQKPVDEQSDKQKPTDADFWKFIKGFYLFEDELCTDEAFFRNTIKRKYLEMGVPELKFRCKVRIKFKRG
jgi:hypothetical protein